VADAHDPGGGKTLWLLRHAKARPGSDADSDHARPLESRGQRAAVLVGAYLVQRECQPALALCSSARRTVETLDLVAAQLPRKPRVVLDDELYLASPATLLERVRGIDEDVESALLVGHNPGIAELARRLARRGERDALKRLDRRFPTGALAELRFPGMCWGEIELRSGELADFSTPKALV
jgi:phosphohistidine phosphatase